MTVRQLPMQLTLGLAVLIGLLFCTQARATATEVSITAPTSDQQVGLASPALEFTGPVGATYRCKTDSAAYVSCTSPFTLGPLANGQHDVTVFARHADSTYSVKHLRFAVDAAAPVVVVKSPSSNQRIASGSFTATFSADEPATFTCKLDAEAASACSSPRSYTGLADGTHSLTITATDAGGASSNATSNFAVDTAAPQVSITAPLDAAILTQASGTVTFTSNATSVAGDVTTARCRVDTDAFQACSSPFAYPGLTNGDHVVVVVVRDLAGNASADVARFRVRTPTVVLTSSSDNSHATLNWVQPIGATSVEILRNDLDDPILPWSAVRLGVVPAAAGSYRDAQLWFNTNYRYTLNFKNGSGGLVESAVADARTLPVTAAALPVAFSQVTAFGSKITAPDWQAATDVNAKYSGYLTTHLASPNMTLRKYAIPVYEAKASDPLIGPFTCGYGNCDLPKGGASTVPLPVKPSPTAAASVGPLADAGSDHHLTIVAANGATAWDFFRPDEDNTDVDKANLAVWNFAQSGGTFALTAGNATATTAPAFSGANAANFANLAGLIRPEELALGEIRHALVMSVPGIGSAVAGQSVPACPATHNAKVVDPLTGSDNPNAPPEGLRFRLDPAFNVATIANPVARTIAKAMQDYGVYIRDNGGTVSVYAEGTGLSTTNGATVGGRGYDGWNKADLGLPTSSDSVGFPADFPWNQLKVVKFTNGPNC